jgi:DNA-binding transcriptional LysR family regulator
MAETIDLELFGVFAAIAEARSFTGAAKRLRTTKATVSRSLARLEEMVGEELVHRNTRTVSLSTAGTALYERIAPHVAMLREAAKTLPASETVLSGDLRITAPPDVGTVLLPDVLTMLSLRYPGIRVDARLTNDIVDLVAEGFDLAIRMSTGPMKDSTLTSRKLGTIAMGAYASPTYLARRGTPKTFGDADHEWLIHRRGLTDPVFKKRCPRLVSNDMALLRDVARAGAGIAHIPTFTAAPAVSAGELARVALPMRMASASMLLVYPSSGQVARKVEAFRDMFLEALRARPLPP